MGWLWDLERETGVRPVWTSAALLLLSLILVYVAIRRLR
jgi:hypothetical protein